MNKYLNFISDDKFLSCVKKVVESYQITEDINHLKLLTESKNTVDEFKTLFDICVKQTSIKEWSKFEITRQQDKTINNKIGEFHQEILGNVDGWINLGIGDETEVDLKKEDNSIFIELKNKYNTMNSSSEKICYYKLENIITKYPNSTAYWAYIINKDYKSEDRIWNYKKNENERIRRISGDKLYELVTGDSQALRKTFNAIPNAIVDIMGDEYKLQKEDETLLKEYQKYYFNLE